MPVFFFVRLYKDYVKTLISILFCFDQNQCVLTKQCFVSLNVIPSYINCPSYLVDLLVKMSPVILLLLVNSYSASHNN